MLGNGHCEQQTLKQHQHDEKCQKTLHQPSLFRLTSCHCAVTVGVYRCCYQPQSLPLPSLPCPHPSGVLLCCQITKWLFACCKQRKQILYRYYIYIEMFFFPLGNAYWNTYTSDTHSQRQYTLKDPHSSKHTRKHIRTYIIHNIYAIANSNLWKKLKESHFLSC